MADDLNPKENEKMIFENVTFFMRPCKERQELRPEIENAGGKVTSKATTECYKLAEKGSIVSREGYISTDFVEDCIKQKKLLSVDSYRVKPGTVARADADKSFAACSSIANSDDSFEHASVIIKTTTKECKGRTKYTKEEDVAMMTYLIEENRYQGVMGKRVWKDMEMLKITGHSAESMSARYRKYILNNLDKYKYDIEKSWVSRLRGYIEKEKEPEFSFDALFPQPRKKPPLQMTSSASNRQKDRLETANDKTNKNSNSSDKVNKSASGKTTKHTVLSDKTNKQADSNDTAKKKVNSCDKLNTPKKSVDKIKNQMLEIEEVFSHPPKHKQKSAKDNVDSSGERLADDIDGEEEENETRATEVITTDKRQKSPVSIVEVEELDNGTLVGKSDSYDFESTDSDFDMSLSMAIEKAPKRPIKSKYFTSSPKRRKGSHDSNNTKDRNNNSSQDLVTDSPILSPASENTIDSFDDMLEHYLGDGVEQSNESSNDEVKETNKQSSVADNTRSGKHVASAGDTSKESQSAKRDANNKKVTNRPENDKGRQTRSTRSTSKPRKGNTHINLSLSEEEEEEDEEEEKQSEKSDDVNKDVQSSEISYHEDMDTSEHTVDNTRVQQVVKTCRTIASDCGLEPVFVKQLLYGFNGDITATLKWIKLGPILGGCGPWTDSEDEELGRGDPDTLRALKYKYGETGVRTRLLFLEGL